MKCPHCKEEFELAQCFECGSEFPEDEAVWCESCEVEFCTTTCRDEHEQSSDHREQIGG